MRKLMVDVAIVDIHLANEKYTNYEAATLYTSILDDKLDVMIPKVTSMNLQNEQEPIRETMESLLSYDLAIYLQNISSGLKSGDATTVNTALQYRKKWLKTYEILEADITFRNMSRIFLLRKNARNMLFCRCHRNRDLQERE